MAKFTGFPPEGPAFLAALEKNNKKEWFDANRAGYDEGLLEPGKAFVEALGAKLREIDPKVNALPKVNGSIFRIHRDTRFSKDKRPYKAHFDLWFWAGPDKKAHDASGFYLRVGPRSVTVGAGIYGFEKEALAKYRAAVADDKRGPALAKIVAKLEKDGYALWGDSYARVPKPWAQDHPRAELLKRKTLAVGLELPTPDELGSAKLVGWVLKHHKKVAPLHLWLRDALKG